MLVHIWIESIFSVTGEFSTHQKLMVVGQGVIAALEKKSNQSDSIFPKLLGDRSVTEKNWMMVYARQFFHHF